MRIDIHVKTRITWHITFYHFLFCLFVYLQKFQSQSKTFSLLIISIQYLSLEVYELFMYIWKSLGEFSWKRIQKLINAENYFFPKTYCVNQMHCLLGGCIGFIIIQDHNIIEYFQLEEIPKDSLFFFLCFTKFTSYTEFKPLILQNAVWDSSLFYFAPKLYL